MVELMKKAVLEEVEKSSLEFNKQSKPKPKHKHQSLQQKEMYNPFDHELSSGPALGFGHLGNCLGPLTRERPPNFRAKIEIDIYILIFF